MSTRGGVGFLFGGEAASSLPSPLGKGDRAAVDRVLSLMACLRCISSLSFIPLSPSNLRPFGAPPSRGRRECPREPLPSEGAARAQRGGVGFLFRWRSRLLFSFSIGEGFARKTVSSFLHPSHAKTAVSYERSFLCVLLA